MQFTFIDMTGKTLFIRDDAERATWTQEEMTLELLFPYVDGKACSIGQRVYFTDPSTGSQQVYEIKQVNTYEPDHYQQVTAEHICISELSDEHIDKSDVENESCSTVLSGLLSGTLWTVGNIGINPVSSVSVSRGSVWQAVLQVKDNWNVYIEPRVTFSSDGTIGRYLDIKSTSGEWNGVRLSVDKNFLDPSVTYDDSEVATALYGYGGTILDTTAAGEDHECNFADVVWTATADHPAKPAGQTYIEDPAATAEFGRNGRARFGFYQNTDITDPAILLQKTWDALKVSKMPSISIEGSVEDLYRMGYADQPIKLHDIALVEVLPAGFKKQIQIIKITTDLLDPSSTMLTIGDYIPNIVYIERKTNESATGSRGGGGRNKSNETERHEFETAIETIDAGTGIRFRAFQNDLDDMDNELKLQEGRITVAYNKIETEVVDRRNADGELAGRITVQADRITQEVTERKGADDVLSGRITVEKDRITQEVTDRTNGDNALSGRITVEANRITQEVTDRTNADNALSGRITVEAGKITQIVSAVGQNGEVTAASICLAINNSGSSINLNADKVVIGELSNEDLNDWAKDAKNGQGTFAKFLTVRTLTAQELTTMLANIGSANISILDANDMYCDQLVVDGSMVADSIGVSVGIECDAGATIEVGDGKLKVGTHNASWKTASIRHGTNFSTERAFCWGSTAGISGTTTGCIALDYTTTTIHYLGY